MSEPLRRSKRSIVVDTFVLWIITVLAYCVVGFLRGQQLIRNGLERLRPERDWPL